MPISDAHTHFLSQKVFESLATPAKPFDQVRKIAEAAGVDMPSADPRALADRWVEEMVRAGVARQVLLGSALGDEESVAAALAAYPERFAGFCMVSPVVRGLETAKAALERHRFKGLALFPAMHRYELGNAQVAAVVEVARAHHAPVFIHCGILRVPLRELLGLPSPFDLRLGDPLAVASVAVKYPDVPFIIPSFGAGFFDAALVAGRHCRNVYIDTASSNSWRELFGLSLGDVFARALAAFGPQRILFGSDSSSFPRGYRKDVLAAQQRALLDLNVPLADQDRIFGKNLEGLLAAVN